LQVIYARNFALTRLHIDAANIYTSTRSDRHVIRAGAVILMADLAQEEIVEWLS
jgi:hypothetical protein